MEVRLLLQHLRRFAGHALRSLADYFSRRPASAPAVTDRTQSNGQRAVRLLAREEIIVGSGYRDWLAALAQMPAEERLAALRQAQTATRFDAAAYLNCLPPQLPAQAELVHSCQATRRLSLAVLGAWFVRPPGPVPEPDPQLLLLHCYPVEKKL